MPDEELAPRELVQAAERSFAIIRAFGQRRQMLTQSQVADATGLSRATARRFLHSMEALGYVGRDGRQYYLRPRVLDLGYAYLSSMSLWDVAKSHMEVLAVPLHDKQGRVIASMNVCAHASRVSAQRLRDEFLPPLLQAAAAVDRYTSSRP